MAGIGLHSAVGSPIMMIESPILTSACMILPSGCAKRPRSSASKACLRKSISLATPGTTRYGVAVWYPSGMYLTAMAASSSE